MPALYMHREDAYLTLRLGGLSASVPWSAIALTELHFERLLADAVSYGRELFDATFGDEQLRGALLALRTGERLVLVSADPLVSIIQWEYLRQPDGQLLAGRLNMLRGLPDGQQRLYTPPPGPVEIVALPAAPVDDRQPLDTEREWRNLVTAVSIPEKRLTLTRVRPPTLSQLGKALPGAGTSIVHFMGHSVSYKGEAFLAFEDMHGCGKIISAAHFAAELDEQVLLVILNSCYSAVAATTDFGNIARGLVQQGVPYALGMQFALPDDAALIVSQSFYDVLLKGRGVEEAVRRMRRGLEEDTRLAKSTFLAGIPVLYTCLREPCPPLHLEGGSAVIQPNPQRLQEFSDLAILSRAEHLLGRAQEISQALELLLAPARRGFVLLHGLGGIGKTSLAYALAERVSWYYNDHVLAASFETFATLDAEKQLTINATFVDRFLTRLARFYKLDPLHYPHTSDLQRAILQQRVYNRSLLVLDNIETLIDALRQGEQTARGLATFISRLKEGDGCILLTSRVMPPSDWGQCESITLVGLDEQAGADLLFSLLAPDRVYQTTEHTRLELARRMGGHPLSIRLLAGRFSEIAGDLATFLGSIEDELKLAEQATPTSLEDPGRHTTLYACMYYSIKHLTAEEEQVLHTVSIFQAPFLLAFAEQVLEDEVHTEQHLQRLVRLGLLTLRRRTFADGVLELYELHPMLRWYLQYHLPPLDERLWYLYAQVYTSLAGQSYQTEEGYDQSPALRALVRQSLVDCEAALPYLPPAERSLFTFHLAKPYERMGQYRRALALLEESLSIDKALGDPREIAITQGAIANLLVQLGQRQEARALYEQVLLTHQALGDPREIAITQGAIANLLVDLGQRQEARALYEQVLLTEQALGDPRSIAITQGAIADLLVQLGQQQEARALYEQVLLTQQALGDPRSIAITQGAIANLLVDLGQQQEARALYEQVLLTEQALGDPRSIAITQANYSWLLFQQGEGVQALEMIWLAYISLSTHELPVDGIQRLLIAMKEQAADEALFDDWWTQSIKQPQPAWLSAVQAGSADGSLALSEVEQTVVDFVNAESWSSSRKIMEERQILLFSPEAENYLKQAIMQAHEENNQDRAGSLEMHLDIIYACQQQGIAATFKQIEAGQQQNEEEDERSENI